MFRLIENSKRYDKIITNKGTYNEMLQLKQSLYILGFRNFKIIKADNFKNKDKCGRKIN